MSSPNMKNDLTSSALDRQNGYAVLHGEKLNSHKLAIQDAFGDESSFVTKTTQLGVFDSRSLMHQLPLDVPETHFGNISHAPIFPIWYAVRSKLHGSDQGL
jgi:hypothetical protein